MRKILKRIYVLPLLVTIALVAGAGFVIAYLSASEQMTNKFTVGSVETTIVEEFPPVPELTPGNNDYPKKVSVKNTGYSESYIRVAIEFSSKDIEDKSYFYSSNGNTYYKISEFKNHLPAGWEYVSDPNLGGAYYYYTRKVGPGETTPQLITNVRTTFGDGDEPVPYDIYVYAEGVQAIDAKGDPNTTAAKPYLNVWKSFLKAT